MLLEVIWNSKPRLRVCPRFSVIEPVPLMVGIERETTTSINTGFDIALWNGRIQSSFDIYWSKTKDLLLSRSIPTINRCSSFPT